VAADLGFGWSRLAESNRRPSHYESVSDRLRTTATDDPERDWCLVLIGR
jgi:hypothetical protein